MSADDLLYGYDPTGKITSVTHPNEAGSTRDVVYTYDRLHRVLSEKSSGVVQDYTYDKAGNRHSATYGGTGRQLTYGYDALNRQTVIGDNEEDDATAFGYDLNGSVVERAFGAGLNEMRSHDARNRLTQLRHLKTAVETGRYDYQYDRVGNVREIEESYPGGLLDDRTITNTYDGTYRLMIEETHPSGESTETVTYAYDKGNNRVSKTVVGGLESGTTIYQIGTGSNGSGANQIQKLTFPDLRTVEFEYDLNGNRVLRRGPENEQESSSSEEKVSVYQYDYENRLVELDHEDDQGATTGQYLYGYDYRTRRVRRTEPGTTGLVSVVFSGGVSIEEFGSGGASNPLVEYVRGHDYGGGIGGLQYSVRGDTVRYNQYNGRGDVVSQTNAEGVVKYQTAYEAFGEHPVHVGTTKDRQKTNTKEEDPTGLLNEGFRYRDLLTGTFITRDPAGFVDGPNLYTYVHQNPWSHFDPEGLQSFMLQIPPVFTESVIRVAPEVAIPKTAIGPNANWTGQLGPISGTGPNQQPSSSQTAKDNKQGNDLTLFRAMRDNGQGAPKPGADKRSLGVLLGPLPPGSPPNQKPDITPVDGVVYPGKEGMSVSPNTPLNLSVNRRPPEFDGKGKDPVWSINKSQLPSGLRYDQDSSTHGTVQPSAPMSVEQYQHLLQNTQKNWKKVTPPPKSGSGEGRPEYYRPPGTV